MIAKFRFGYHTFDPSGKVHPESNMFNSVAGDDVQQCSVEDNIGCGEHQKCEYTHHGFRETHCVCQDGYQLNNITQTCMLSALSTPTGTDDDVMVTPQVGNHQSCNVEQNTGCGANQKCQRIYFSSIHSHCICIEGYIFSGDDCVPVDITVSNTQVLSTVAPTLKLETAMPVQIKECTVSSESFSPSQLGVCGEHAYCRAVHVGEELGHCDCHQGYSLDSKGNCVDNLIETDGHVQSATSATGKVVQLQKCNPWNFPPDKCGDNAFCHFVSKGGGHCLCNTGYTFSSQHSCVLKDDADDSPTTSNSLSSTSHSKSNMVVGERTETVPSPKASPLVFSKHMSVITTPPMDKTTTAFDHILSRTEQLQHTGVGGLEGQLNALEHHTSEPTVVQTSAVSTSTPSFPSTNKMSTKASTTTRMKLTTAAPIKTEKPATDTPPMKTTTKMLTTEKAATTDIPATGKPIISEKPTTRKSSQIGTALPSL